MIPALMIKIHVMFLVKGIILFFAVVIFLHCCMTTSVLHILYLNVVSYSSIRGVLLQKILIDKNFIIKVNQQI